MAEEEEVIIEVNEESLAILRQMYIDAVEAQKDYFIYSGCEIFTEYAKHLIEYLEDRLDIPLNERVCDNEARKEESIKSFDSTTTGEETRH